MMEINRQRNQSGLKRHRSAFQLYRNAELLQLGVSDPSNILFERIR
jgi:hypothetical protein